MGSPNLFSYAPKELSQDGYLSWLLSWSDPKYREVDALLHECGVSFVRLLISKHDPAVASSLEVSSIVVGRQWNNVDVWARVNDGLLIIIEDKTSSDVHGDQLERYRSEMGEVCSENDLRLVPIYLKTGVESSVNQKSVSDKGYGVVTRADLLELFSGYPVTNAIFTDFRDHLSLIENAIGLFERVKVGDWDWNCWRGFFVYLESCLKSSGWSHEPNKSGGVLCLWWAFHGQSDHGGYDIYLQLNHVSGELGFRIGLYGTPSDEHKLLRNRWSELIRSAGAVKGLPINKPAHFGYGQSMNVAVVPRESWLGVATELIEKEKVVERLSVYEEFLSECVKNN
jgi:hypothetical protein